MTFSAVIEFVRANRTWGGEYAERCLQAGPPACAYHVDISEQGTAEADEGSKKGGPPQVDGDQPSDVEKSGEEDDEEEDDEGSEDSQNW